MPVLTPSGLQFYISDLDNEVLIRCENKTSDLSRADIWLRDALIEITSNPDFRNEFDALEEYGPQFLLQGGYFLAPFGSVPSSSVGSIQEYQFANVVPAGDYNIATLDFLIWQDPPINKIRRQLRMSHYQKADNLQPTFSLPTEWYRFADTFGVTPCPDKNYQVQARIVRAHPINDTVLAQTLILIPREWNEILIWAAVERGFMEYLEFEKASAIHQLLYGDPKHPDRPGLIEGRKKRREMEAFRTEQPLRPCYRPSCFGK
jgi:hypothetical protein